VPRASDDCIPENIGTHCFRVHLCNWQTPELLCAKPIGKFEQWEILIEFVAKARQQNAYNIL